MKIFCQRDPAWAENKLGNSELTIARAGCYCCVLAMINNIFGAQCTPADVAAHQNFFDANGIIQNSILGTDQGMKDTVFDGVGAYDPVKIDEYLADWANKQMAIKIQLPRGATHFMKIDQKDPTTGRYICSDPWTGHTVDFQHYGDIILGIRYFSKRVPSLP